MRPRLNHWCVIGWVDATPNMQLCVQVSCDRGKYGLFFDPESKRLETINHEQVLRVLTPLEVPSVPPELAIKVLKK